MIELNECWLDLKRVAGYLKVSPSQIRKLVGTGQIPFRRLPNGKAGKLLFNRRQVDLWLLSGAVNPSKRQRLTFESIL